MPDLVAAVTHTGALVFTSRKHATSRGYDIKRAVTAVAPPKYPTKATPASANKAIPAPKES